MNSNIFSDDSYEEVEHGILNWLNLQHDLVNEVNLKPSNMTARYQMRIEDTDDAH